MPHEYQFEWSAPFPNASTLLPLSKRLADLAVNRSKWFRTKHVLIPWGCDYMYHDATLTFTAYCTQRLEPPALTNTLAYMSLILCSNPRVDSL